MEISLEKNFQEIKNDPLELSKLLSKYAEVNLVKNTVLKGFISSMDPVTHSLILLVPQENEKGLYETVLIPGHAVLDIVIVESEIFPEAPLLLPLTTTCKDHKERKGKLMEWFRSNLLTVTECDENILFGNVTILPPYTVDDICTDNPIIALQVKKVIENMPHDFSPQIENNANS